MKKRIILAILLTMTLIVTGCDNNIDINKTNDSSNSSNNIINNIINNETTEKFKVMHCTLKGNFTDEIETNSNYKVTHDGEYVKIIETEEVIISNDSTYLEDLRETVESLYYPYNDIKYYDYEVSINGNTLTSITKIDYSKIDMDELLKVNYAIGSLMEDGKLKVSIVKELYEKMGITCE